MHQYVVRQQAQEDLQEIWLYSLNMWGVAQADTYIAQLIDRFDWLASNPFLGKHRTDIHSDYYCYQEGRHHIFYIINHYQIEIIGVPHQQMDVVKYFE